MKLVKGIWLPDNDTHIAGHLEQGPLFRGAGTYQLVKIEAALEALAPAQRKMAFDVGGHVGLWSRVLAESFATVHAFEPVSELRACFEANVTHSNVMVHPHAISNTIGVLWMRPTAENSGNSHVSVDGPEGCEQVDAIRLDDFCEVFNIDRVDFIKIDTEGYEYNVIEGARKLIERCHPMFMIEQKRGAAERYARGQFDAKTRLEKLGYRQIWARSGDYLMEHKA